MKHLDFDTFEFGTRGSEVQILSPRPFVSSYLENLPVLQSRPTWFCTRCSSTPTRINTEVLPSEECGDRLQNRHRDVTDKPDSRKHTSSRSANADCSVITRHLSALIPENFPEADLGTLLFKVRQGHNLRLARDPAPKAKSSAGCLPRFLSYEVQGSCPRLVPWRDEGRAAYLVTGCLSPAAFAPQRCADVWRPGARRSAGLHAVIGNYHPFPGARTRRWH